MKYNIFFSFQGRQREPGNVVLRHSVRMKTRSLLSAEFWRHCVLSGGTLRTALARYQSKEMKILNISFFRVGFKLTTCRVYSHTVRTSHSNNI